MNSISKAVWQNLETAVIGGVPRVRGQIAESESVAAAVDRLERRLRELDDFVGRILATLEIEKNRRWLKETPEGRDWISVFDDWINERKVIP